MKDKTEEDTVAILTILAYARGLTTEPPIPHRQMPSPNERLRVMYKRREKDWQCLSCGYINKLLWVYCSGCMMEKSEAVKEKYRKIPHATP